MIPVHVISDLSHLIHPKISWKKAGVTPAVQSIDREVQFACHRLSVLGNRQQEFLRSGSALPRNCPGEFMAAQRTMKHSATLEPVSRKNPPSTIIKGGLLSAMSS
jgi:hypothetical protein